MRRSYVQCRSKRQAFNTCPWASVVVRAVAGWWCFESVKDFQRWSLHQ